MKKFLALLLIVFSLAASAQVSVQIVSVTPVTRGQMKGDSITYIVSSPNDYVQSVAFEVEFGNGEINGGGSVRNPGYFSYRTAMAYQFVGLRSNYLNMDRTYTIQVIYGDLEVVYSDPYTVTGK